VLLQRFAGWSREKEVERALEQREVGVTPHKQRAQGEKYVLAAPDANASQDARRVADLLRRNGHAQRAQEPHKDEQVI
jgi:hypothetical protein